jgi:hypothetical protein
VERIAWRLLVEFLLKRPRAEAEREAMSWAEELDRLR